MSIISDGLGRGNQAGVNNDNQLLTRSVNINAQSYRSLNGYGFNLNTGNISLTSGSESAVMYLKYTGEYKFNIDAVAVGIGALGGTVSNPALIKMIRNPSTGTIVDNTLALAQNENRLFSSSRTLGATAYKGAEGYTFTDGDDIAQFYQNGNGRLFAQIDFILSGGNSVGITITPNATSGGDIYVAIIGHEELE